MVVGGADDKWKCLFARSRARRRREYWPPRPNGALMDLIVALYRVGDYVGFNTGNGEKLSFSQAEPGLATSCFAVA